MILNKADIIEYKNLVKARFNKDISDAEALEDALSLIQFVGLTQKNIAKLKKIKEEEKMPEV